MTPDLSSHPVMDRVRQSLKRAATPASVPPPPDIPDVVARLVPSAIGLPELFITRAGEMKMLVEAVAVDQLVDRLSAFLTQHAVKSVMLSDTPIITRLNIAGHLRDTGFHARQWADMTADDAYDFDCGLTEVDYAVAETGTLVIRHGLEHGRLLSLTPFVHVAIVEPPMFRPRSDRFDGRPEAGRHRQRRDDDLRPEQNRRHRNEHRHRRTRAEHRQGVRAGVMRPECVEAP